MVPFSPDVVDNGLQQKLNNCPSTRAWSDAGEIHNIDHRGKSRWRSGEHPTSEVRPNCSWEGAGKKQMVMSFWIQRTEGVHRRNQQTPWDEPISCGKSRQDKTAIQETKEYRRIPSMNQTRLFQETRGEGCLIIFQVAFEKNFGRKEQAPLRQRKRSWPRTRDGGCIVERTTCKVSASSDLAGGMVQWPLGAATQTEASRGILRSLVLRLPNTEINGPRSVHQSNQKLTDLPSPILHLIILFSSGLSFIIRLTVDEKIVEVEAVQKVWPYVDLVQQTRTHLYTKLFKLIMIFICLFTHRRWDIYVACIDNVIMFCSKKIAKLNGKQL